MRISAFVVASAITWFSAIQCNAAPSACVYLSKLMDAEPNGPVFLASYPTAKIDQLKGVAFLYDNALAIIALTSCGYAQKAIPIGDAILSALKSDRHWHDGRLRNAYLAGPVAATPLKLPGWWDNKQNKWVEDGYQVASDNGNLAWAILALLTLHRAGFGDKYLEGASRIGAFVEKSYDPRPLKGFTGGTLGDEPTPQINTWKSTEHNADLAAAFQQLADRSEAQGWSTSGMRARRFVSAMWMKTCRCFAVGTTPDGHTLNTLLALDAQIIPLLMFEDASSRYESAITTAQEHLRVGPGFAYSEFQGGIWTEGTAQVALLMSLTGHRNDASSLLQSLDKQRDLDGAYYATDQVNLPTGFTLQTDPAAPLLYFHLPHLGATSWVALAQTSFNPLKAGNRTDSPR